MTLSIFTPVYNRSKLLLELFRSLMQQSCQDFEWIIVDDGSQDDIQTSIAEITQNAPFSVQYHRQKNSGKHVAINEGLKLARAALFFIVDSDDLLSDDAVQTIIAYWQKNEVDKRTDLAGIVFNRIRKNGAIIGGDTDYQTLETDYLSYFYRYNYKGDKAEVFKTDILRQYPFPSDNGEKFCPEALVWRRIGEKYRMIYLNEGIYICEYLEGGLTDNSLKIRAKSPVNSSTLYKELMNDKNAPFNFKLRSAINFWRFYFYTGKSRATKPGNFWSLLFMPFGFLFFLKDKFALKKGF